MELDRLREEIDCIDKDLVKLIERRLAVAKSIGQYKKDRGLRILDPNRELEVIAKNLKHVESLDAEEYVQEILEKLMSVSRKAQSEVVIDEDTPLDEIIGDVVLGDKVIDPIVAFGGIKGSYGEQAVIQHFGTEVKELSFKTFNEVVAAVLSGEADYGVLPMENTSTGNILDVERLLENNQIYIAGEEIVEVAHCLLGLGKLEDIKTVYSHVQGFLQSSDFLKEHNFKEIPYFNTAISAKFVAESGDKTLGAIASKRAAEVYGLKVLKEHINFNSDNFTRFIIIRRVLELDSSCNKVSVQVILEDKEGSLLKVIKSITENRLNMVKIASRPIIGKPFEYIFSIDFNGNIKDKNVKQALKEIKEQSVLMSFKGNYKEVRGK